jgi:hypothetical protein
VFAFSIAAFTALSGGSEPKVESAPMVGSFSEISAALARDTDRVFDPALIKRSPTFKLLIGTHSIGLWNELILRPGDNFTLSVVGLMCIEQERPDLAFDAAARCLIASARPGNDVMGYATQILQKGARERNSTDRIARMIESGAGSDDAVVVLVSVLTRENLVACFDALDVDQCAASRLAWVVSALNSPEGLDEKLKAKYRTAHESFAATPGIARCTYLSFIDDGAADLLTNLRLAILDPDVRQIYLIPALRRFGKPYRIDIETWLERASDERRTFVRKYLSP